MSTEVNRIEALFDTNDLATEPAPAAAVVIDGETDPRGPHYWRCSARPGRNHDISMRRPGGGYACWYCVKTKAQLQAAHDAQVTR